MDFRLRLVIDSDLPDVQRLYDARPDVFRRLLGRPAEPDQAVGDFLDALRFPNRFQFAVMLDETLLGLADCQLDDETEGLAHIGMVLLAPEVDHPEVAGLVVRVIERWLARDFGATRVETAVVAQAAEEIAFWQGQGYDFTGSGFRRDLGEYRPRFLQLFKDLAPSSP